jgi:hypothetical protein
VTLLRVSGQLWREIPSTGGWYTVAELAPGLYAYRYSDNPTEDKPMTSLSDLDRRLALASLLDRIERDCRGGVTWRRRKRTDGPLRTLALVLVAGLAAVLAWMSRRER